MSEPFKISKLNKLRMECGRAGSSNVTIISAKLEITKYDIKLRKQET
jgi:hypothetical protein